MTSAKEFEPFRCVVCQQWEPASEIVERFDGRADHVEREVIREDGRAEMGVSGACEKL